MAVHYDITDFRLFAQIERCGSLTQAAAQLCISVPAASSRLKKMEEAVGVALFHRGAGGMRPTPTGEVYLRHAQQVLTQLDLLTADLHAVRHRVDSALRIMGNTIVVTQFLPALMRRYLQQNPDTHIDVRERLSGEIVESLLTEKADIGIVTAGIEMHGLCTRPFASSRLVVVALRSHSIAQRREIAFKELMDYEFVSLMSGTTTPACLSSIAEKMNLRLRTKVQVPSFDDVCTMVCSGVGIGIVPFAAVARGALSDDLAVCELIDPWARNDYLLCSRDFTTLPQHVRDFVTLATAH
ncbi:LysR family transcriptional regulator [Variovorax paradoxus]|jgi:molybdate transport repressor ModE-like protein|uniref:LysR family transcriptional regulator n=1 Tax=Variovorax paradoxus TaxID=34073 RepID=UPI003AAA2E58